MALQIGLLPLLFYLVILTVLVTGLHVMFGYVALKTPDAMRFPGFVGFYFGKPAEALEPALVAGGWSLGQSAHAGSPGGLVAPHQGHPRPRPVHTLKVEDAFLHPNICQPRLRPVRARARRAPDLHAYLLPRPRTYGSVLV